MKNTTVFTGFKNKISKGRENELDCLIISEPLKLIIHCEMKANNCYSGEQRKKAAEQLNHSNEFFKKFHIPKSENWKIVHNMMFKENKEEVCSRCQDYVLSSFSHDWWNHMTSLSTSEEVHLIKESEDQNDSGDNKGGVETCKNRIDGIEMD